MRVDEQDDDETTAVAPARVRANDIARVVQQLDVVEGWMASAVTPRQAVARAMRPAPEGLGMTRHNANRYVSAALARLQSDGAIEPIESKRARMIATLHAQVQRALSLKRTYEQDGKVVSYDNPDLKAANSALSLLAQIDGLVGPSR